MLFSRFKSYPQLLALLLLTAFPAFTSKAAAQTEVSSTSTAASGDSKTIDPKPVAGPVPVLVTYRSSFLSSRLALDGARLKLQSESGIAPIELDLDSSGTTLMEVRRKLTDLSSKILIALEPTLDASLPPIVDSLGLTVVATSYLEGVITPATRGLYSVFPRMSGVREAVERFFITQPKLGVFSIICSNTREGVKYSEIWNDIAAERKIKVSSPNCGNEQSFDFRVSLLRAKGQGVDGFGVGFGTLNVISRLHEMSWPRPLLLTALQGEQLLFDTTTNRDEFKEIFFDSPVLSEIFTRAYSEKYGGRGATISSALGYEAVTAISKLLSQSSGTPAGMSTISYNGVSGPIDFTVENTGNGAKSVLMRFEGPAAVRIH